MHKVLIVDDELLVRANLKVMIDWNARGFEICGEAGNGIEALRLAERERPDLILSDIRMPGMDGLELSGEVARLYPRTKLVVLSNFDDFDYVKGALRNGALDYLLKHKLNPDELASALDLVRSKLDFAASGDAAEDKPNANHLLALKKKFLVQLVAGFAYSPEEISHHLRMLDLKLAARNLIPVVLSLDDYGSRRSSAATLKAAELEQFSVVNVAEEILGELDGGAVSHVADGKYVLLFSFPHLRSEAAIERAVNDAVARIANCLKTFLNLSASFSIGPMCPTVRELPAGYARAEEQLQARFHLGKNVVLRSLAVVPRDEPMTGLDIAVEKRLTAQLRAGDEASCLASLGDVFAGMKAKALSPAGSQLIFNDLLGLLHRTVKEAGHDLAPLYADASPPHEALSRFETLGEAASWFAALFRRTSLLSRSEDREPHSEHMTQALRYIRDRYADNLSLTEVAERIGISGAYLSTLFRNELGTGFSEYVTDLRLAKAKMYLEEGDKDMKEIAALCGFNGYNYFFQTFKKKTGLTPGEYARKAGSDG
ncbi:response regulator [Paenibacillaceae bacterium WGS1546]|uniref:response regulator n=1 Tax=Cohnella sp. WGS1546 TaxID=3366810 RepID=UPI00372D7C3F